MTCYLTLYFFFFYIHVVLLLNDHIRKQTLFWRFCLFTTQPQRENFNTLSEGSDLTWRFNERMQQISNSCKVSKCGVLTSPNSNNLISHHSKRKNNPVSNGKYLTFSPSLSSSNFPLHLLICRPCPACGLSWGRQ